MKRLLLFLLLPISSTFAQQIFTVPLQPGTTLANVRYEWIANGTAGSAQSSGITQPDSTYTVFRISATPPSGAEEVIVYDSTDSTNWNTGGYRVAATATTVTTNLDATTSSRMASYTQPTGFLSATFPSGTIANTTNITAGTITTAANLTTNNDKTGYSLTVTPPTSAQIATTIFTDLLSTSDFSTASSFGKLVKDDLDAAITTRLATSGYTAPDNADAAAAATNTTNLPAMLENVSGYRFTTHALMQGPGGSIDYSAAANAIWNFDLSAVSPSGQKTENYLKRIK